MLKKIIISITFIFILIFSFTSCSFTNIFNRFVDNDEQIANKKFEQIFEAINNKDIDALRGMFSKTTLNETDNIDEDINSLYDFIEGNVVTWNRIAGPTTFDTFDYGEKIKDMQTSYEIETSEGKYSFAIQDFIVDTANPDNVGIYSMYIINTKDIDEQFAYWGDGEWTIGININVKNALPDEDS